jgi:hypothetical protein
MKWISPRVEPQEGFNDSSLVYEMKSSGLKCRAYLQLYHLLVLAESARQIKKMTTINKGLLIARAEHFSIISINDIESAI